MQGTVSGPQLQVVLEAQCSVSNIYVGSSCPDTCWHCFKSCGSSLVCLEASAWAAGSHIAVSGCSGHCGHVAIGKSFCRGAKGRWKVLETYLVFVRYMHSAFFSRLQQACPSVNTRCASPGGGCVELVLHRQQMVSLSIPHF